MACEIEFCCSLKPLLGLIGEDEQEKKKEASYITICHFFSQFQWSFRLLILTVKGLGL